MTMKNIKGKKELCTKCEKNFTLSNDVKQDDKQ